MDAKRFEEIKRIAQHVHTNELLGNAILDLLTEVEQLRTELEVTDKLLAERNKVLAATPECPLHGSCVPYALEWIGKMRQAEKQVWGEG